MSENIEKFEAVLCEENRLLDVLTDKQNIMKKSVTDKNWDDLTKVISEINFISEQFVSCDKTRDEIQENLTIQELKPFFETLRELRAKLLKCKIENQALSKYVNITREFIRGVVEKAIPQTGAKVYSRSGQIVQKQPQSVVLNQLF